MKEPWEWGRTASSASSATEHDALAGEVHARFDELFERISTSSFLLELYRQHTTPDSIAAVRGKFHGHLYNSTTYEEVMSSLFRDTPEEELLRLLARLVLIEAEEINSWSFAPFWNLYGDRFKALTEYPPLLEYKQRAKRLLSAVELTIEELATVRIEICRWHGIPRACGARSHEGLASTSTEPDDASEPVSAAQQEAMSPQGGGRRMRLLDAAVLAQ